MKIRLLCDHEFCHQDRTTIVKIPKGTVLDAERKGEKRLSSIPMKAVRSAIFL